MLERLKKVLKETCKQMDVVLIECNGEDDHIHLMVNCPPKLAIANLVGKLKGKSSYILRREFAKELESKLWGTHFWSPSYCVVSCGGAPLKIVRQYIENQRVQTSEKSASRSQKLSGDNHPARKKKMSCLTLP